MQKRTRGKKTAPAVRRPKDLKSIDEEFVKKGARGITDDDIKKVTDKADEIKHKVVKSGPLQRFIGDVKLLVALVQDYRSGKYRKIPYWAITAIAFTLLYIIKQIDLIPDFIPI